MFVELWGALGKNGAGSELQQAGQYHHVPRIAILPVTQGWRPEGGMLQATLHQQIASHPCKAQRNVIQHRYNKEGETESNAPPITDSS